MFVLMFMFVVFVLMFVVPVPDIKSVTNCRRYQSYYEERYASP